MTSSRINKVDIARTYCRANPDAPHRTIARIMFHDCKGVWSSVENARQSVQQAIGAHGASNRASMRKSDFKEQYLTRMQAEMDMQEAGVPEETDKPLLPRSIGTGDTWLALGDQHIPEHSKVAIDTQIWHAKKNGIKNVLLMGDVIEHSHTSRHPHDPNKPDPYSELKALTSYLKHLRNEFKGRIVYKAGNHEANLKAFVWRAAPELASLPCLDFEQLIGFDRMGIEYIDERVTLAIGKLSGIHGHEYRAGSAVFPAQWLLRRARSCAFTFHFHRSDTARGKTVNDAILSCWSVGCARSLAPSFCTKNEWNWGHAVVRSCDDGNFEFSNYLILRNKEVVPA